LNARLNAASDSYPSSSASALIFNARTFQSPGGELDAPVRQILHRRLADERAETFGQDGARAADLPRQPLHGPRLSRPCVQQSQGPSDHRIAQSSQPAGVLLHIGGEMPANRLDEDQFADARQHAVAPGGELARLAHCIVDQLVQPLAASRIGAANDQQSRQRRQDRTVAQRVAHQEAADDFELVRFERRCANDRRQCMHRHRAEERQCRIDGHVGTNVGLRPQSVGIALREDQHVTGRQRHRRLIEQTAPAVPPHDGVVGDHVARTGNERGREGGRRRRLGCPGMIRFHQKERRAGQADAAQRIREDVDGQGFEATARARVDGR